MLPWAEGLTHLLLRFSNREKDKDAFVSYGEGDGTHSSVLAWRIPGTEEPGGLRPMGSRRVGLE